MTLWKIKDSLVDYSEMINVMESEVTEVINGASDRVFLLEHQEIYTRGTSAKDSEILDKTIPIIESGRGGKITYHGPGQRVIYPILNLASNNRNKDLKLYIRNLEDWIIDILSNFAIKAYTISGKVGIWTLGPKGESKIAAIGVRVKKWVTYHGVAVNISNDLTKFHSIIPCGIEDAYVTSIKDLGVNITLGEFDDLAKSKFTI